jgi:hypothetical protein
MGLRGARRRRLVGIGASALTLSGLGAFQLSLYRTLDSIASTTTSYTRSAEAEVGKGSHG